MSVDPLAEKYPAMSPYNYVMNNPINLIDPTGMGPQGIYRYNVNTGKHEKVSTKGDNEGIHIIVYHNNSEQLKARKFINFDPGSMSFGDIVTYGRGRIYNIVYNDIKNFTTGGNIELALSGLWNAHQSTTMTKASKSVAIGLAATVAAPHLVAYASTSNLFSLATTGYRSRMGLEALTETISNGGDIAKVNLFSVLAAGFTSNVGADYVGSQFSFTLANGPVINNFTTTFSNLTINRINKKADALFTNLTSSFPFNNGSSRAYLGSLSVGFQSIFKYAAQDN